MMIPVVVETGEELADTWPLFSAKAVVDDEKVLGRGLAPGARGEKVVVDTECETPDPGTGPPIKMLEDEDTVCGAGAGAGVKVVSRAE